MCTFVQGLSLEFGDHASVYAAAMKEKAISKPLLSPKFQPRHVRSVPSQVIACAGMLLEPELGVTAPFEGLETLGRKFPFM